MRRNVGIQVCGIGRYRHDARLCLTRRAGARACSSQGSCRDLPAVSRRAVPMAELVGQNRDSCLQVDGVETSFLGGARSRLRSRYAFPSTFLEERGNTKEEGRSSAHSWC